MIHYEPKQAIEVTLQRPDFQNFLLLDQQLQGTKLGMDLAMKYMRDSFMINNGDFRFMYMQMGVKTINHMEVLAQLIHQMHGSDDRYYDEDNDDTPTHELIPPLKQPQTVKEMEAHHTNNDITAITLFHLQEEKRQIKIYEALDQQMDDTGAHQVFQYIIEGKEENVEILNGILHTLSSPNEVKDFGLDATSPNAFSPNSGNYFDKPNPEFLNESECKTLFIDEE